MKKRVYTLVIALLLVCSLTVTVSAKSNVDLNAKGSITVKAVYQKSALKGMELNCVQVGEVVQYGDSYYFKGLYNDNYLTAEEINDPDEPEKALKFVNDNPSVVTTKTVDSNGNAKFENLHPGLYLIYQTKAFTQKGKTFNIKEFFVTVPYDGKYDVDIKSKPGLDLYPEQPTEPTTPPSSDEKLPQTGQLSWPVPILAFTGIAMFILGWGLRFSGKKDAYEK